MRGLIGKRSLRLAMERMERAEAEVARSLRTGCPVAAREASIGILGLAAAHGDAVADAMNKWLSANACSLWAGRVPAELVHRMVDRVSAVAQRARRLRAEAELTAKGLPKARAAQARARRVAAARAAEREAARAAAEASEAVRQWRPDMLTAEIVERDRSGLVVLRGAAEVPAWTRLAGVEPWMAEAGRVYAALVERCDSPGAPSTLGRVDGGRWGGGCATDGRLHRARLLAACRAALGEGEALSVRRPAVRGDAAVPEGRRFVARRAEGEMLPGRRPVLRRDLADAVLVGGASLAEVLGAHGWTGQGDPFVRLRDALLLVLRDLADALGRRERPARADCA